MNIIPWWFHKLLLYYLPTYVVYAIEQPWVVMIIMGAFSFVSLITISSMLFCFLRERKKRKLLEVEHQLLQKNYIALKQAHETKIPF